MSKRKILKMQQEQIKLQQKQIHNLSEVCNMLDQEVKQIKERFNKLDKELHPATMGGNK